MTNEFTEEIDLEYLKDCLKLTLYERFIYVQEKREELFKILPSEIKNQIIKKMYDISDKLDRQNHQNKIKDYLKKLNHPIKAHKCVLLSLLL